MLRRRSSEVSNILYGSFEEFHNGEINCNVTNREIGESRAHDITMHDARVTRRSLRRNMGRYVSRRKLSAGEILGELLSSVLR